MNAAYCTDEWRLRILHNQSTEQKLLLGLCTMFAVQLIRGGGVKSDGQMQK